jgi:hypothetical protein
MPIATKEVSFSLLVGICTISASPKQLVVNTMWHLLVLDVNKFLCEMQHLKLGKNWKPLIPMVKCENKLVSTSPKFGEFLELNNSKFDIGIWSSTTHCNLFPMVDFLLQGRLGVNHYLCWVQKNSWKQSFVIHYD